MYRPYIGQDQEIIYDFRTQLQGTESRSDVFRYDYMTILVMLKCEMRRAQAPPRCTKCNSPPINGQCTNHCIAI